MLDVKNCDEIVFRSLLIVKKAIVLQDSESESLNDRKIISRTEIEKIERDHIMCSSFPIFSNASIAKSKSSLVMAAFIMVLMRALSRATIG